jgi:hypothetical protein
MIKNQIKEVSMKKIIILFGISIFLCYGEIKKATFDEIKKSTNLIEETIKAEKEDFIPLFSQAIEIEKRANTKYYAEKIAEKICKTSKIEKNKFEELRNKFSFFDISIAWAINQIKGKSVDEVLKEKGKENWYNILAGININTLTEKLKELNPKSKTF